MKTLIIFFVTTVVLHITYFAQNNQITAIVGGIVIDLSNKGSSKNDLENSVILIKNEKIISVGTKKEIPIPENAKIINAAGKYIIPGLIDGFAVINNQAYANAYLYMGVTSIIGVSGGRRGEFFSNANPGPTVFKLDDVGYNKTNTNDLLNQIEKKAKENIKVLLLMYKLKPEQLKPAVKTANKFGIAAIGELGYSNYYEGINSGIDAFVHTTRYSLDIAPKEIRQAVAENPFSDDLESPKWIYYKYLSTIDSNDNSLLKHAKNLGGSNVFIMPTLSLLYLDIPGHKNPWQFPAAKIINSFDIDNPADKLSGNHKYDKVRQDAYTNLANNILKIETVYQKSGASYLAGSASDVWGTMPGISLHTELELLNKIGLTNREAMAAATTNFSEAFQWDCFGKIKNECFADILILDKNPLDTLENLQKIYKLFLHGKEINRQDLLNSN